MGTASDIILKLDFEAQPSHTVTYDTQAELAEKEGRNGKYNVSPVIEDGMPAYLAMSNQTLVRQLQRLPKGKHVLKITREGSSYSTSYKVEQIKKLG